MCNAASWCRPGTYCDTFDRCFELYRRCQGTPGAACNTGTFPYTMICGGRQVVVQVRRYQIQVPGVGVIECDHAIMIPMSDNLLGG